MFTCTFSLNLIGPNIGRPLLGDNISSFSTSVKQPKLQMLTDFLPGSFLRQRCWEIIKGLSIKDYDTLVLSSSKSHIWWQNSNFLNVLNSWLTHDWFMTISANCFQEPGLAVFKTGEHQLMNRYKQSNSSALHNLMHVHVPQCKHSRCGNILIVYNSNDTWLSFTTALKIEGGSQIFLDECFKKLQT